MAIGFPTKANWAAGDVLTASAMDDLAGTVNTVQWLKPWNTCLNSNFSVWQRGTSISYNNSTAYSADRWQASIIQSAATITRQATSDTTNLPNIQYCARVQRTAGNTQTNDMQFSQSFESVNSIPYAGKAVAFSFYARAGSNYSAASNALQYRLVTGTGTDQNILTGFTGQANAVLSTATLTTTWQRFTGTATLGATITQIAINFVNTPVGTAGANDYYEVTGVQLEQGSVANTYQPNQSTFQGELAACQRYYQQGVSGLWSGMSTSTATYYSNVYFAVQMRTTPTSTVGVIGTSGFASATYVLATPSYIQAGGTATATAVGSYYTWSFTSSAEL